MATLQTQSLFVGFQQDLLHHQQAAIIKNTTKNTFWSTLSENIRESTI